ncbi:ABC transporter permease [Nodosilinea sp. LEGE 07298]|uniref:ABC transporter permease n=1 Tax=Nodosilinea sp. LEGE 07298 TaxID=2777970 RepID=UPI001D13BCF6|nr:ABC transporter permease [Nodosilinea sp. LEGE 07298]
MAQSSTSRRPLVSPWDRLVTFATSETVLYVVKRILQAALTLLLASALSFFVIQLAPGNFLDQYRQSPQFSPETLAQLETQFGLDQPVWRQYLNWLYQVIFHGNFGLSFAYQRPVVELLLERVPNTLLLSLAAIAVTWLVALPMGILGAVNQNRFLDKALRVLSYLGQGMPTIVTGLLLLFFAQSVAPLFPIGGRTSIIHDDLNWFGKLVDVGWHLILPTLALSITSFAGLQRITRGQLLDVLRQNYIQTARAKGLSENRVVYVHALRNAINPLITLLGFEFASLLGGSFIIETYFNWPGLSRLILEAVQAQDLYLVMASLMIGAIMLIIGNLLADLALSFVDPRIRLSDIN